MATGVVYLETPALTILRLVADAGQKNLWEAFDFAGESSIILVSRSASGGICKTGLMCS